MKVSLTPRIERFVQSKVESGRYNSSGEVVLEALRLLEQFDTVQEAKLEALRADIAQALGEVERGETVDYDSAVARKEGRARDVDVTDTE